MAESVTTNLRQRLRGETSASHARLDRVMGLHPPFASVGNYRRYLQGMDSLYEYCEVSTAWVEGQIALPIRETRLRKLIQNDLVSTGAETLVDRGVSDAQDGRLTEGTHWGKAYVMEGSAMGATFLVKQAEQELPTSIGKSFLQQLALDAKSRWSIFAEALASTDASPNDAVTGAKSVFDYACRVFGNEIV